MAKEAPLVFKIARTGKSVYQSQSASGAFAFLQLAFPDVKENHLIYYYSSVNSNIEFNIVFLLNDEIQLTLPVSYFLTGQRMFPAVSGVTPNPSLSFNNQTIAPFGIEQKADKIQFVYVRGTPVTTFFGSLSW